MRKSIRHDAPIHLLKDDQLERSGFARRVAASLFADARTKESSVIALCGNWGEGKTSAKNLVKAAAEEQAKAASRSAPNWVEFSPWQVNGLPSIESLFFDEIGTAIGKAPGKGSPDERMRRWKLLGTSVQAIGTLAEHSAGLLDLAMPGSGVAARFVAEGAKKISDASKAAAEGAELSQLTESLSAQKMKLRQLMLKLDAQIVVVIDDMDRLGDDEVLLVLRLIKANADFPNLTYLLLFQRDIVERAVHRKTSENGSAYLEKFVQVFLDLPQPNFGKIRRVVADGLTDLVNRLGISWERFEKERWANLWQPGLSQFFHSMRDAYRYLNVVDFRMAGLVSRGVPEVNMLDVFAMECLRLFEPAVHSRMLSDPDLFLRKKEYSKRDSAIQALDGVIELAHPSRRDATKAVVEAVFPAASGAYRNMGYDNTIFAKWETQARICTETIFHRFYAGELGEGMISEADIADILAVQDDRKRCVKLIRKQLARKETAPLFLERIAKEDCFKKPTENHGLRLAIWDTCDEFPTKGPDRGFGGNDLVSLPYWTLADALRQMDDTELKRRLVTKTMFASKGFIAFVWVADGCENRHEKVHFWPNLTDDETMSIKAEAIVRLQRAAQTGEMLESNHGSKLLWMWKSLNAKSAKLQVERWLAEGNKTVVSRLLRIFIGHGTSQGMDSYYVKKRTYISWNELEKFAPCELWIAAVNRTIGGRASKKIPEEIALFRKAEKQHLAGKSDLDRAFRDDEDE